MDLKHIAELHDLKSDTFIVNMAMGNVVMKCRQTR